MALAESRSPALFLDRDGVVNVEVHRLHRAEDVVVIDGVAAAISAVNGWGVPVIVVTNQAGIGHGLYDEAALLGVNRKLTELLAAGGARIDDFLHCPHTPADACDCRKPAAGMLLRAAARHGLDLTRSVLVGDKRSDLDAARSVGCAAVLVRTGYGREVEREILASGAEPRPFDACRDSLLDALGFLEQRLRPRG